MLTSRTSVVVKNLVSLPVKDLLILVQEIEDQIGLSTFMKAQRQGPDPVADPSRFDSNPNTQKKIAALLDAPSHALPPMSVLAPAFLELLVCDSELEPMETA